jgi:hypothetical protein
MRQVYKTIVLTFWAGCAWVLLVGAAWGGIVGENGGAAPTTRHLSMPELIQRDRVQRDRMGGDLPPPTEDRTLPMSDDLPPPVPILCPAAEGCTGVLEPGDRTLCSLLLCRLKARGAGLREALLPAVLPSWMVSAGLLGWGAALGLLGAILLAARRRAWVRSQVEHLAEVSTYGAQHGGGQVDRLCCKGARDAYDMVLKLLVLLVLCLPRLSRAEVPERPAQLTMGEYALSCGWPTMAFRACRDVVAAQASPWRLPALVCQGRAALLLKWPLVAERLARRALREQYAGSDARVLLADALREQGKCWEARPLYLQVLEVHPDFAAAKKGLEVCGASVPPRANLPPRLVCGGDCRGGRP